MAGEGNYQDLQSTDIVSVEVLPDPPPPPAHIAALVAAVPSGATLTATEMHVLLSAAGAAHNIDEDLLASVIRTESGGNVHAVSRTGARGLMQLMPGTARTLGVQDPNKPDQNINGGTAYLDALLKRYKDDVVLALAAYNAGPRRRRQVPRRSPVPRNPRLRRPRHQRLQPPQEGFAAITCRCRYHALIVPQQIVILSEAKSRRVEE